MEMDSKVSLARHIVQNVVPFEHTEVANNVNLEIDISILSPEDRALYDRCVVHNVEFIPPADVRNESLADKVKRQESIKSLIKKRLGAERQRKRRMLLTDGARKDQRLRDASRQRQRRAAMTDEDRKDQRNRDAERQRQRRAHLTPEEREEQRLRDKDRQRKRRSTLLTRNQNIISNVSTPKAITPGELNMSSLPLGAGTIHNLHQDIIVKTESNSSDNEEATPETNDEFLHETDEREDPQDAKIHENTDTIFNP